MSVETVNSLGKDFEQEGILSKTGNLLAYGITGAVISGVDSIINTGVELGNFLGGDFDRNVVSDDIRDLLGDEAEAYYKDNQTAVDIGGLVLGSVIPGSLAVTGARALAAGKLASSGSKLVSGWANSMTNAKIVEQTTTAVAKNVIPAALEGNRLGLLGRGFVQAATDNLAYETATLLTMNQSSALNPDDLGYFESIGSNIGLSMMGVGVGTAIGTGLSYIATKSALTKFIQGMEYETRKGHEVPDIAFNTLAGDYAVTAYDKVASINTRLDEINNFPLSERQMHAKETADLQGMRDQIKNDIIAKLNNNSSLRGQDIGGLIVSRLDNPTDSSILSAKSLLARTEKITALKKPTRVDGAVVGAVVDDAQAELPSLFVEKYLTGTLDTVGGIGRLERDLLDARLPDASTEELVMHTAGLLKASTLKSLWEDKLAKVYFKDSAGKKIPSEQVSPDVQLAVNLPTRKDGTVPTNLHTMLDVRQGLINFLSEFDPAYSAQADFLSNFVAKVREKGRLGEAFDDVTAETYGQLTKLSMYGPAEMFSSAYRILNRADLGDKVIDSIKGLNSRHRALYEYLDQNKALQRKYGAARQNVNIRTGEVTPSNTIPYFSDLGKVTVTGGEVTAGSARVSINPKSVKHWQELDSTDVNGLYIWAVSKQGAGAAAFNKVGMLKPEWEEIITSSNLPMLEAARQHFNFSKGGHFVLADTKEVITDSFQLESVIREAKFKALDEMSSSTQIKYTDMDKALRADVDKEFTYARAARRAEQEAATQGMKPATGAGGKAPESFGSSAYTADNIFRLTNKGEQEIIPQHVQFHYGYNTVDELGVPQDSILQIQQRMRAQQDIERQAAMRALGLTPQELAALGVLPDDIAKAMGLPTSNPITAYKDINALDSTTSMLTGQDAKSFTGQALAQERGRFRADLSQRADKAVKEKFSAAVKAVHAVPNDAANHEMSLLLSSVLRQDQYALGTLENMGMPKQTQEFLKTFGLDVERQFTNEVLKPLGWAAAEAVDFSTSKFIISLASREQFAAAFKPLTDPEFLQVLTRAKTDANLALYVQTAVSSAMQNVKQIGNRVFSQEASVGGKRLVQRIEHDASYNFLKVMQQANDVDILQPTALLRQAENSYMNIDSARLYAGRPNLERHPFYALVKQTSANTNPWAASDSGYILATSQADLQRQVQHIINTYGADSVEVITGSQIKNNLKARGTYQYELDLTENAINSTLKNEGKLWDASAQFNPNALEDYVNDFIRRRDNVITKGLGVLYREDINGLEFLDKAMVRTGSFGKVDVPVSNYRKNINLMLGLNTGEVNKVWQTTQEAISTAASRFSNIFIGKWAEAQTSGNWENFAKTAERFGLPNLITGKEQWFLDKAVAKSGRLSHVVSKLNGALSFGMLKLDAAHQIVNAISMPILAMPAMTALKEQLAKLPAEQLERIGAMTTAPLTAETKQPSNIKLMMQAVANFHNRKDLVDVFDSKGLIGKRANEMRQLLNNIAYKDTPDWLEKANKAIDKVSTPADWTEDFLRFVSGDMARQVLEAAGIQADNPLYWSTITGVINKINGNYVANQRAGLFQGWLGSAIGLFQTYQFNLINQFTKHIADNKAAARQMIALQTGIFGAQSLPGFALMNNYLGEKALGERDIYSTVSDTLDTPVAEFLLYGGGSSLTRPILGGEGIDLFTRGNLNPRSVTIIPTQIKDIPAAQVIANMYKFLDNTIGAVAAGENAGAALGNAIAHNGMVRPLQGAAQLIMGSRTTNQGSTLMSYEDFSWANAATKLMGTQTMSEGIAVNAYYRSMGYRAQRMKDLANLAQVTRQNLRAEKVGYLGVDTAGLLKEYVSRGGNARTFHRWYMNQVAGAQDGLVATAAQKLQSPEGRYLQGLLGNDVGEISSDSLGSW